MHVIEGVIDMYERGEELYTQISCFGFSLLGRQHTAPVDELARCLHRLEFMVRLEAVIILIFMFCCHWFRYQISLNAFTDAYM